MLQLAYAVDSFSHRNQKDPRNRTNDTLPPSSAAAAPADASRIHSDLDVARTNFLLTFLPVHHLVLPPPLHNSPQDDSPH